LQELLVLSKINSKSALLIYDNENEVLLNNVKNIKNIKNIPEIGTNVYDILKYHNVLFTHSSIKKLQERLLKWKKELTISHMILFLSL